jgi:translation initiation factor IF-3
MIRSKEMRVVHETKGNLGVLSREKALAAAKEDGLDIVLISPTARPPIAKIVDFDKFRFEEKKKKSQQRKAQKANEMKQIQISVREGKNDLQTKLNRLHQFFEDDAKVEVQMTLRGREKANKDWAKMKLQEFLDMIEVPYKVTKPIMPGGRGFTVQVVKDEK